MPTLELTDQEWQSLMVVLTNQPWEIANPILYKMARQASAIVGEPIPARPDGAAMAFSSFVTRPSPSTGG